MKKMSKINAPCNIIILIGMMGSGKSKCGNLLAKILKYKFYDIDKIIESEQNLKITQIFNKFGESYFRKIEKLTIEKKIKFLLDSNTNAIVSLGGGGFNCKNIRKKLITDTKVVWLDAPLDILAKRVGNSKNRPMLKNNTLISLQNLQEKRAKYYEEAHIKVLTNDKSIKNICDEIIKGIL